MNDRTARPAISRFDLGVGAAGPYGITQGSDSALWITLVRSGELARLTHGGQVRRFSLDAPGSKPSVITSGPDGALWFTRYGDAIGRMSVDGMTSLHRLEAGAAPVGICSAPDAVWFVQIGAGRVGRITPSGQLTEYSLPDRSCRPHAIITGLDGTCWFTEWGTARLGHLTPSGELEEHDLSTIGSEPHGITIDDAGTIWVALESGTIARVEP